MWVWESVYVCHQWGHCVSLCVSPDNRNFVLTALRSMQLVTPGWPSVPSPHPKCPLSTSICSDGRLCLALCLSAMRRPCRSTGRPRPCSPTAPTSGSPWSVQLRHRHCREQHHVQYASMDTVCFCKPTFRQRPNEFGPSVFELERHFVFHFTLGNSSKPFLLYLQVVSVIQTCYIHHLVLLILLCLPSFPASHFRLHKQYH